MNWQHGGDIRSYELEYGHRPLDFSANISPLGMPSGVKRAVMESLDHGAEYPDPLCRDLRHALGVRLGLPADWILCGNGASDLLYRLVMAVRPCKALLTAPTFSEYEKALRLHSCEVERYLLTAENEFHLTEEFLSHITPGIDLIILCQPNNPTGITIERPLLRQILHRCTEIGTILAIDECFLDFLDGPENVTMQGELANNPLVILRAFTKFYGMAGLRLGYCMSADQDLLTRMQQVGPPWSVSSVAQAAGIAALADMEYTEDLHALIMEQRVVLMNGLRDLGCQVIPGEANYLLFYHPDTMLGDKLRQRGIMLRDCRNYHGLRSGWYRAAVRTEVENRQLLDAFIDCTRADVTIGGSR